MNPELLQIPKRIRELREILDLSTIEVAEKLGVTLDEYQRYESGEQDIPVSTLYEIANILGTDCTVLLTGDTPRMNVHTVVRKGEGVSVDRYEGYQFESLALTLCIVSMEPMLVTLEVQAKRTLRSLFTAVRNFNFVLEGQVESDRR